LAVTAQRHGPGHLRELGVDPWDERREQSRLQSVAGRVAAHHVDVARDRGGSCDKGLEVGLAAGDEVSALTRLGVLQVDEQGAQTVAQLIAGPAVPSGRDEPLRAPDGDAPDRTEHQQRTNEAEADRAAEDPFHGSRSGRQSRILRT
jgi:hypothetical protein